MPETPSTPAPAEEAGTDALPAAPVDAPQDAATQAAPPAAAAVPDLSPAVCASMLAERFPALFGAGRALPLKLRIQADIQARAPGLFNKKTLSIFLHRYTTSTAYLKALVASPQRCDLDGAAAGDVAEEHRSAALAEIERRRGIVQTRRDDERALQREAATAARQAQVARQSAQQAARAAAHHSAEANARRDRAALLRAFETTTLTPHNFCALKGLVEADLQAQLTLARQEREQRPPQAPRREPARHDRGAGQPDRRGPRPARGAHTGKPQR